MSGTKDKHYWDSCIFISWLEKDEHHDKVASLVRMFEQGDIFVVSSDLIYTEVFDGAQNWENKEALMNIAASDNFDMIHQNPKILKKAEEFFLHSSKDKNKDAKTACIATKITSRE